MRNLSAAFLAQITAPGVRPAYFVQINFVSGPMYFWTGIGPVTWNGQTWTGTGRLGRLSGIVEVSDVSAQNVVLTLEGIPSDLVADVIGETNQTNAVLVWFGFLDASGNVIADPVMVFQGTTDVPTIVCGPQTSSISISCENPLVSLQLASNRIYSANDQFLDYPADNGFDYVPSIQDWNGNWGMNGGSNPARSGSSSGSGTGSGTTQGGGSAPAPSGPKRPVQ